MEKMELFEKLNKLSDIVKISLIVTMFDRLKLILAEKDKTKKDLMIAELLVAVEHIIDLGAEVADE